MPSPVSRRHCRPDGLVHTWLGAYSAYTPGTEMLPNVTVILDPDENCAQPDGCLRIVPEFGGQSADSPDGYIAGPPELSAEIAVSSVSIDLHQKLHVYERHGVREYLVWRVWDQQIDWFSMRGSAYRPLVAQAGVLKSKVFPGLWLDVPAMLDGDMVKVLQVLHQGIASDTHRRFVARLAKHKRQA